LEGAVYHAYIKISNTTIASIMYVEAIDIVSLYRYNDSINRNVDKKEYLL
jgi:hypothetical protein